MATFEAYLKTLKYNYPIDNLMRCVAENRFNGEDLNGLIRTLEKRFDQRQTSLGFFCDPLNTEGEDVLIFGEAAPFASIQERKDRNLSIKEEEICFQSCIFHLIDSLNFISIKQRHIPIRIQRHALKRVNERANLSSSKKDWDGLTDYLFDYCLFLVFSYYANHPKDCLIIPSALGLFFGLTVDFGGEQNPAQSWFAVADHCVKISDDLEWVEDHGQVGFRGLVSEPVSDAYLPKDVLLDPLYLHQKVFIEEFSRFEQRGVAIRTFVENGQLYENQIEANRLLQNFFQEYQYIIRKVARHLKFAGMLPSNFKLEGVTKNDLSELVDAQGYLLDVMDHPAIQETLEYGRKKHLRE